MWLDSFIHVTWLIHTCDLTHSYMWLDSFIHVTWLIHTCDFTHSYMWLDSFIHVTWLIYISAVTHEQGSQCHKASADCPRASIAWVFKRADAPHQLGLIWDSFCSSLPPLPYPHALSCPPRTGPFCGCRASFVAIQASFFVSCAALTILATHLTYLFSLSRLHTHSLSRFLSVTFSLALSLSVALSRARARSLSLSFSLSFCLYLSLYFSLSDVTPVNYEAAKNLTLGVWAGERARAREGLRQENTCEG